MFKYLYDRSNGYYNPASLYDLSKGNNALLQRMSLLQLLDIHNGCVNSIIWDDNGELILSGSDDHKLVISNPWNGNTLTRMHTAHRANIFSAKFLPYSNNSKIISCSGDGMVLYTDVENHTDGESNWKFCCHSQTCFDVLTVPGCSNSFMTCGEDGTIRWVDLRTKTKSTSNSCKDDILINMGQAVTSIAINPVTQYQLAVSTEDSTIRIFDRRMLGTKAQESYLQDSTSALLFKLIPTALENKRRRTTSVRYNSSGTQILASYSSENLYLFNLENITDDDPLPSQESEDEDDTEEEASGPFLKRLRLRGDWSDTGPLALPESELRYQSADVGQARPPLHATLMQRMTDVLARMLNTQSARDRGQSSPSLPEEAPQNDSNVEMNESDSSNQSNTSVSSFDVDGSVNEDGANSSTPNINSGDDENTVVEGNQNSSDVEMTVINDTTSNSDHESEISPANIVSNSISQSLLDTSSDVEMNIAGNESDKLTCEESLHNAHVMKDGKEGNKDDLRKSVDGDECVSQKNTQNISRSGDCTLGIVSDCDSVLKPIEIKKDICMAQNGNEDMCLTESESISESNDLDITVCNRETNNVNLSVHNSGDIISCESHCSTNDSKVAVSNSSVLSNTSGISGSICHDIDEISNHSTVAIAKLDNKPVISVDKSVSEKESAFCDDEAMLEIDSPETTDKQSDSNNYQNETDYSQPSTSKACDMVSRSPMDSTVNESDVSLDSKSEAELPGTSGESSKDSQELSPSTSSDSSDRRSQRRRGCCPSERMRIAMDKVVRGVRKKHARRFDNKSVPIVRESKIFKGHRNARTMIKEASFWGEDHVMSGSDCGRVFVWEKKTGSIVMLWEADRHVVNCLQPHPTYPVLATCGIDYNVKLWAPTAQEPNFDEKMCKDIIQRNEAIQAEMRDTITVPAAFMIRMLASLNQVRQDRLNRDRDNDQ